MTDGTLEVVGEASQQPTSEDSDAQAIVVSDLPEIGSHGQLASETALSMDLREVSLTHAEVQEDIPSKRIASRLDKAISTQAGHSRSLLPDRMCNSPKIP